MSVASTAAITVATKCCHYCSIVTINTTRGAALPQTPLLALIRRESNALGFVVTVVVVAAVVVAGCGNVVIAQNA